MRAHRHAGCPAPQPRRSPGRRDTGVCQGAGVGDSDAAARAGRPRGCSTALHAPLHGSSSHDWHEKPGQRAPRAALRGLTYPAMLWPRTGSVCTGSSVRPSVPGAFPHHLMALQYFTTEKHQVRKTCHLRAPRKELVIKMLQEGVQDCPP